MSLKDLKFLSFKRTFEGRNSNKLQDIGEGYSQGAEKHSCWIQDENKFSLNFIFPVSSPPVCISHCSDRIPDKGNSR